MLLGVHRVWVCQHCDQALKRGKAFGYGKQQVYDLTKVEMQVTEHRAEIKTRSCYGQETWAAFLWEKRSVWRQKN